MLLVATGRRPNVEGIGLEAAGVEYNRFGVTINDTLQTSNPNIYAVGDVATKYQFTHVAGTMAQMVVQNALFGGDNGVLRSMSKLVIPWVTYTNPEIAHVGMYEAEAKAAGIECDTFVSQLAHNDRAILEEATNGFVKVHCKAGTEEIIGATIVGECAGELITELTLAIQHKIGLGVSGLGGVIHAYPTVADAVGGVAFGFKMRTWETMPSSGMSSCGAK